MRTNGELPPELGASFSVLEGRQAGVPSGRLRGRDLTRPFFGVRARDPAPDSTTAEAASIMRSTAGEEYERLRAEAIQSARLYAHRMRDGEFFSHGTAALIWNAPLPRAPDAAPHVSTLRDEPAPRSQGVHGHRVIREHASIVTYNGFRVTSPACTWAMLGHLDLFDLVAVGDYFARVWRSEGYYRPNAGMPPLASLTQLADAVGAGRRVGIRTLRGALPLIRTDSWSRTETVTRLTLTQAGLPEPVLNRDFYDEYGEHLGCIDLAYPQLKIAIEYQGQHHGAQYARDIERIERLRAAGWIVIQVTSTLLFGDPAELVRRVRAALAERGWRG